MDTTDTTYELVPVGTCQLCQREMAVVKGRISRHGWRVHPIFKMRSGVCWGSKELPLEQSRDFLLEEVSRLSKFTDFGPETISPRGLITLISRLMDIVVKWSPRDLKTRRRYPEPMAQRQKVKKDPEPPKPPKSSESGERRLSDTIQVIAEDPYQLGDEVGAPICRWVTLKSGAIRLKAERKLTAGDLVLVPAHSVATFSVLTTDNEVLVPTRVIRTSKSGQALDFIYVGKALLDGVVDETTAYELRNYHGIFQ